MQGRVCTEDKKANYFPVWRELDRLKSINKLDLWKLLDWHPYRKLLTSSQTNQIANMPGPDHIFLKPNKIPNLLTRILLCSCEDCEYLIDTKIFSTIRLDLWIKCHIILFWSLHIGPEFGTSETWGWTRWKEPQGPGLCAMNYKSTIWVVQSLHLQYPSQVWCCYFAWYFYKTKGSLAVIKTCIDIISTLLDLVLVNLSNYFMQTTGEK